MIETSQQQFIDSVFGIRDLADPSKLGQFDASAISADTARVLAFPNASGTIALEGWVDDNFLALDGEGTDVVNGTFNLTTTGTIQGGSITDGVATLTGGNLTDLGGLTLTGFTGILKAVIGVVTSDAIHGDLADVDWTTVSDHDLRYFTETELSSNANGEGASLIGIEDSMSLYAATDVEAALAEVMDEIHIVTHVADSVTMDVGSATGSVSDTYALDDGNIYNIDETTGPPNPNFVATFDFSGITAGHEPNLIELHWSYNGGSGHIIELQMYNYNTSTWDVIDNTILTDNEGDFHFDSFSLIDGGGAIVDYTSGGAARVRFSHAANGNAAHDFCIDYLAIKDDHGIGSGITDHGSLSGLGDDDHFQYHNDARAATWLAAGVGTIISSGITIFSPTPILVFKDSNSLGSASVGYIEWRDSGGGRAGFLGNNSAGNDDLYWKNEQGGNIGIETTGAGELQIIADTVVTGTLSSGVITQSGATLANTYQPLDAGLTSLAGLTYAAASFVKMTGANAFALRTIGETANDLEGTIVHDNLASVHQGVATGDSPTFAGITIPNGGTIGLSGGPIFTFTSTSIGVGTSAPKLFFDVRRTTAGTNILSSTMAVSLESTGTPAAGFGPSITFFGETATPNVIEPIASFGGIWEDATAGTVDGAFVMNTRISGGEFVQQMKIGADGGIHFANLKSGTDQANAGASAGELYSDTNDDNTIKMGI